MDLDPHWLGGGLVVLYSQVQTPLDPHLQHALTVCAVYCYPMFSSGPRPEG